MKGPGDPDDAILNVLSEQIDSGMVTSFVLVAVYTDDEGDTRIWSDTMRDQRSHQTLGLLSWGLAVENERVAQTWREDDDDG